MGPDDWFTGLLTGDLSWVLRLSSTNDSSPCDTVSISCKGSEKKYVSSLKKKYLQETKSVSKNNLDLVSKSACLEEGTI